MKFRIKTNDLKDIFIDMSNYVEKSPFAPINEYVLMEAEANAVVFKGFKQGMSIMAQKEAMVATEGKGLMPILRLKRTIAMLEGEDVDIEIIDKDIIIKQEKLKYKVPVLPADEYEVKDILTMPKEEMVELSEDVAQILFKVEDAAYRGDYKPAMQCVDMNIDKEKGCIKAMGTDSRLLEYTKINTSDIKESGKRLLPIEFSKKLTQVKDRIYIGMQEDTVVVEADDGTIMNTSGIKEQSIKYEPLLEKQKEQSIVFPKSELIKVLKRMETITQQVMPTVILNKKGNVLKISINEETSSGEEDIALAVGGGADVEIPLSLQYLLKGLNFMNGEELELQYTIPADGKWEGILITSNEGEQYVLIMPISR